MTGLTAGLLLLAAVCAAQPPSIPTDEALNYTIHWPSGLSLGEGRLEARRSGDRWSFALTLDAALPGFAVTDHYRSAAAADLCALEAEKDAVHGARKARETTTFDYDRGVALRTTAGGGGKTEVPISGCAHDALGFLFHLRRELAAGRLPPPQAVWFGALYQVRLEHTGLRTVPVNQKPREADRLVLHCKGPASHFSFEMFIGRDAARTPLLVRVPFPVGTFSMELAQ